MSDPALDPRMGSLYVLGARVDVVEERLAECHPEWLAAEIRDYREWAEGML